MSKKTNQAPVAIKRTGREIMAMDDRPAFPVDAEDWGRTGEAACMVRKASPLKMLEISREGDGTALGTAKKNALLVIEFCQDPQFFIEDLDGLMNDKSWDAVATVAGAILMGPKKKEPLKT